MRARVPSRRSARSRGAARPPGRNDVPDDAARYRVAPGVTHREIAGQSIVLGPSGVLYTFAGSGGVVWPVIAGGAPLARAMDELAGRYGIAPAQARRDVLAFARQLGARGLVRRQSTPGRRATS